MFFRYIVLRNCFLLLASAKVPSHWLPQLCGRILSTPRIVLSQVRVPAWRVPIKVSPIVLENLFPIRAQTSEGTVAVAESLYLPH